MTDAVSKSPKLPAKKTATPKAPTQKARVRKPRYGKALVDELRAKIGLFERPDPRLFFTAPDPELPLWQQRPDVLFAMLLFGEARGESREAMRAVAQVVINRARHPHKVFGSRAELRWEENLRRVILQPRQFSCLLQTDPNYVKVLRPLFYEDAWVWRMCLEIARDAMTGLRNNKLGRADTLTRNSDHYFDESLLHPPSWADPAKQTVEIGRLRFYRLYLPPAEADAGTPSRQPADALASRDDSTTEAAAALPSLLPSSPPHAARRAAPALLRIREGLRPRHRRAGVGCGSHVSSPAPHPPSQRTPRLGSRWSLWSRGLSSLRRQSTGFGTRDSGFGSVAPARFVCRGIFVRRTAHGIKTMPWLPPHSEPQQSRVRKQAVEHSKARHRSLAVAGRIGFAFPESRVASPGSRFFTS